MNYLIVQHVFQNLLLETLAVSIKIFIKYSFEKAQLKEHVFFK